MARRLCSPIPLLVLISLLSLAARTAFIGQPCRSPCRSAGDHLLIFDEDYYVNAARVIAGNSSARAGRYTGAPAGDDPNSEHPQLAKLVMAGSIELLGDDPLAWRLGSIVLGSLAIVGMYALTMSLGGDSWVGLAAAALMATDNLLIVHGRIATLDIYVVAAMIWSAVLYVRGRRLLGGTLVGVGAATKLVAPYTLLGFALFELFVRIGGAVRPPRWRVVATGMSACAASAAVTFLGLLALLDRVASPYDTTAQRSIHAGPFGHIAHMLSYAAKQTSPRGPRGIASYPWGWLVDFKPIAYLNINPAQPGSEFRHVHPQVHFLGMISPPLMILAVPALLAIGWRIGRRTRRPSTPVLRTVPLFGLAWFFGTFAPFVALSLLWQRTSYLYYMVIVMPGIYLTVADLVVNSRGHRRLLIAWWLAVLAAAIAMYPFTPVP